MQQQARLRDLLECGAEGGDEFAGQVADEAHRVGHDHLAFAREAQPPRRRIEGREHLVLHAHLGLGERSQERALAGVCVAYDRENGESAPLAPLAPRLTLPAQLLELALEPRHPVAGAPAVDLELLLARSAPTDAARQARERAVGALRQARQPVAQLGELHLQLAVPGPRLLREDVEDQLGAIDHAQVEPIAEVASLGGRQVLIEDHEVHVVLEGSYHQVLEPPRSEQELRVDAVAVLGHHLHHLDARRARELLELFHLKLDVVGAASGGDRDQDGPLARADLPGARLAGELLLESGDPLAEVELELRWRRGRELLHRCTLDVGGPEGGDVGLAGKALVGRSDCDHGVEPQQREVREIVAGERFVGYVRVNAAEPPQAPAAGAHAPPVGQLDRAGVPDHHMGDGAPAVHEHTHLAPGLVGDGAEVAREFVADQPLPGEPAPREALQLVNLTRFQAVGVSEDPDRNRLGNWG